MKVDAIAMVRERMKRESAHVREQRRTVCMALKEAWNSIIDEVVPSTHSNKHKQKAHNEAVVFALVSMDEDTLSIFFEADGTISADRLKDWSKRNVDLMRTICGEYANKVLPS